MNPTIQIGGAQLRVKSLYSDCSMMQALPSLQLLTHKDLRDIWLWFYAG